MTYRLTSRRRTSLGLLTLLLATPAIMASENIPEFTAPELDRIAAHSPWPLPWTPDPGNRVSGNAAAIRLGHALFFEQRLSANQRLSCATCHAPKRGFQDSRPTARGLAPGTRNTPGLLNARHQRWFGWDGGNDNLWAASLRPILDAHEMGGNAPRAARVVRGNSDLRCHYLQAFGRAPAANDPKLLVNLAKAIAAWQETLVSPPSPFDRFRAALERNDTQATATYPAAAQRGLRLFLGRGQCATCHAGPLFTNGEFADTGMPFFIKPKGVDPGRQGGIKHVLASPYNLLGADNDDTTGDNAAPTRYLRLEHRNFGEFKVPTLRNLTLTAPYMHDGSLATLRDVVRHYSELDEERLHTDGERILKPLKLDARETDDLVAFLESLSPDGSLPPIVAPAPVPACVPQPTERRSARP